MCCLRCARSHFSLFELHDLHPYLHYLLPVGHHRRQQEQVNHRQDLGIDNDGHLVGPDGPERVRIVRKDSSSLHSILKDAREGVGGNMLSPSHTFFLSFSYSCIFSSFFTLFPILSFITPTHLSERSKCMCAQLDKGKRDGQVLLTPFTSTGVVYSVVMYARNTENPYFKLLFSNACAIDRNPTRNRLRVANGTTNPSEPGTPPVVALRDSTEYVRGRR